MTWWVAACVLFGALTLLFAIALPAVGDYWVEVRSDGGAGEVGQYTLLTKDDEVRLAKAIEAGNEAIAELLVRLNERSFRKREGSRKTLFESIDRPALRPLPASRYLPPYVKRWK